MVVCPVGPVPSNVGFFFFFAILISKRGFYFRIKTIKCSRTVVYQFTNDQIILQHGRPHPETRILGQARIIAILDGSSIPTVLHDLLYR